MLNLPNAQVHHRIPVQIHGFHSLKHSDSIKTEKYLLITTICLVRFDWIDFNNNDTSMNTFGGRCKRGGIGREKNTTKKPNGWTVRQRVSQCPRFKSAIEKIRRE